MANGINKLKDFIIKGNLLVSKSEENQDKFNEALKDIKELLWRDIFVDTVKGYSWYHDKSVSLGRWAIGYNYAYVLARVLDEFKPINILECGLGQSSKIIIDYVFSNKNAFYDIVEQDHDWVDFFVRDFHLNDQVKIHIRNIIEKPCPMQEGIKSYVYDDFVSVVHGRKYDFISIDGPWGSERYSRIDIVDHIPSMLHKDFVIMVDDFERIGEQDMVGLLKEKLNSNGITFFEGKYTGAKDICVIVSDKWKFFTTM